MAKEKFIFDVQLFQAEADHDIIQAVQKKGIQYPNQNLAFFKAHYGKIEEPNGNRIRMAKEAVIKALPGLVGTQSNKNHLGEGFINGFILDAWLNEKNEIDIIIAFFKSIYEEDYHTALELMAKKQLNVSFELLSERSTQEFLADGTIRLNDIEFTGVGLLFNVAQAYKNGKVFDMASLYKQRAESNKELVYASQVIESCDKILANYNEPSLEETITPDMTCTCPHCNYPMDYTDMLFDADYNMYHKPCVQLGKFKKPWFMKAEDLNVIKNKEGKIDLPHVCKLNDNAKEDNNQNSQGGHTMTEEQKKMVEQIRAELAGYIPQDAKDEDLLVEAKVAEFRKAKSEAEAKVAQEKAEKEAADVKAAQEKADADKANGDKLISLEAKVKELEATVESQKKEIEAFKAKEEAEKQAAEAKEKADKVAKIKSELKDNQFCKDFTDEDYLDEKKVKDAKILKENADLKAENETLKKGGKVKEEASQKDIDTGHKETEKEESIADIYKNARNRK